MFVERLRVNNFRCFPQLDFSPTSGSNIILGDNGSGKSSLLEALFFLGRGQSFRQSAPRESIRRGHEVFTIVADIVHGQKRRHRLSIQRTRSKTEYSRDGERGLSRLELIKSLPLQIVDPNVHRLLEQGPQYRRQFMDWGVFHVEHLFYPAWQRYRRALRQRNRALKARWPKKDLVTWDAEIVRQGEIVDAARRAYIDSLDERLSESVRRLLGDEHITLTYEPGWRGNDGFGVALATSLERDQKLGFTHQGPHRADLKISVAGFSARDWVSRGQQKLLTIALLFVQAELLNSRRGIRPILLIDDLGAELGGRFRETVGDEIRSLQCQSFLTFLDSSIVPRSLSDSPRFHVEPSGIQSG